MEHLALTATPRGEHGKTVAKRLRASGNLPAVIYGKGGKATSLTVNEKEFEKVFSQATPTTLVDLTVDGQKHVVFIKDTQYDIISDHTLHVDFHEIEMDKPLVAPMKVLVRGNSVGVRQGGVLSTIEQKILVECMPEDLPLRAVADISNLDIGSEFHVKDLALGDKVKIISDTEKLVAKVLPPKK